MLSEKKCKPCPPDVVPMGPEEARLLLNDLQDWELALGNRAIKRRFIFKDFATALDLANKIGKISEEEGHHPDLMLGWGYLECVFWTHTIAGLHENDFIMASKINKLAGS